MDQDRCLRLEEDEYEKVIGSCNGLVCLQVGDYGRGLCFRPWNLATRLRFGLSPPLPPLSLAGYQSVSLNYEFGYDVSCDTYKVLVVLTFYPGGRARKFVTMVHCIGDSCWREILSIPDSPIDFRQTRGLFVGGCVNWLAVVHKFKQLVIVSLDMCEETYQFLSLPEGTPEGNVMLFAEIQVLGNSLCLLDDYKRTHFVVWKMREYGVSESWTRLVSISYEHLGCDHHFRLHQWTICVFGDGDIYMLAKKGELVIVYNLSDNSVKHVELPNKKLWWLNTNYYVESLVSPR